MNACTSCMYLQVSACKKGLMHIHFAIETWNQYLDNEGFVSHIQTRHSYCESLCDSCTAYGEFLSAHIFLKIQCMLYTDPTSVLCNLWAGLWSKATPYVLLTTSMGSRSTMKNLNRFSFRGSPPNVWPLNSVFKGRISDRAHYSAVRNRITSFQ